LHAVRALSRSHESFFALSTTNLACKTPLKIGKRPKASQVGFGQSAGVDEGNEFNEIEKDFGRGDAGRWRDL
jgi:hypothetical protein